VLFMRYVENCL